MFLLGSLGMLALLWILRANAYPDDEERLLHWLGVEKSERNLRKAQRFFLGSYLVGGLFVLAIVAYSVAKNLS